MAQLKKVITAMEDEFASVISGPKKHHISADLIIEVQNIECVRKFETWR